MITLFLKYRVGKLLKSFVRKKIFREYEAIKRITILFEIEDFDKVVDFVDLLEADGKDVTAFSYDTKNHIFSELPANYTIWNKTKMTIWGMPNSVDIKLFKDTEADTLIDLTYHTLPIYNFLFLNSSADFRVGFDNENSALYDLLIERNRAQDFSFFVEQLLFYMKSLRSK